MTLRKMEARAPIIGRIRRNMRTFNKRIMYYQFPLKPVSIDCVGLKHRFGIGKTGL